MKIRKSDNQVSCEWQFLKGGYCGVSWHRFVFLQRFFTKGQDYLCSEKEFVFRFQANFDSESKASVFTLEMFNPREARIFYLWIRLWKHLNFCLILNFGFRLTKDSKKRLSNWMVDSIRRRPTNAAVNV